MCNLTEFCHPEVTQCVVDTNDIDSTLKSNYWLTNLITLSGWLDVKVQFLIYIKITNLITLCGWQKIKIQLIIKQLDHPV